MQPKNTPQYKSASIILNIEITNV